jgi:hypothetical protein
MNIRVVIAIATGMLLAALATADPASADTAPVLACGSTITVSCTETAHFNDVDAWLTPAGPASNCPPYIDSDFVHQVATGNGVEHNDFWTTNTFTGDAKLIFYSPGNVDVTIDDQGNVVSATPTGPSDDVLTGHFAQWFGVSDNKQNGTFGLTFSFNGTDQFGNPITIHGDQHQNWTPGSQPFAGPPHHLKAKLSC